MMTQEWKYNTLHLTKPISENQLKRKGKDGWELAGCVTQVYATTFGMVDASPLQVTKYLYYFKMPRETVKYGGPR